MTLLAVALGGAAGALARFLTGVAVPPGSWPRATFVVNVTGSFALGWLTGRGTVPAGVGAGLLGGFTTLSTWAVESVDLHDEAGPGPAALYAVGTVVAAVGAAAAGLALA